MFDKKDKPAEAPVAAPTAKPAAATPTLEGLAFSWRKNPDTNNYEVLTFSYDPVTLEPKLKEVKDVGKLYGNAVMTFKKKVFFGGLVD